MDGPVGRGSKALGSKASSVASDPKVEFAHKAIQAIRSTKSADGSATGEKVGDRIEKAAGALGEQAAKAVITEGLARAADTMAPGAGGAVVKAALKTRPAGVLVDRTGRAAGAIAATGVRWSRWWTKWVLLSLVGGGLVLVGFLSLVAVLMTGAAAEANRSAVAIDSRITGQAVAVAPGAELSGGSFAAADVGVHPPLARATRPISGRASHMSDASSDGDSGAASDAATGVSYSVSIFAPPTPPSALGTITHMAHVALVETWIRLLLEDDRVVEVDVTAFEFARDGGIRLVAMVTTEEEGKDGETVTTEREVVSRRWYYQVQLEECHPTVLAAGMYNDLSGAPNGGVCWKLNNFSSPPAGAAAKSWMESALGGVGTSWDPPIYDYAQCVAVTGYLETCEAIFDELVVGESPGGPTAAYLEAIPTLSEVLEMSGTQGTPTSDASLLVLSEKPDPDEQDVKDMKSAFHILEHDSAMGDFGQAPVVDDGLRYEYEALTSEGTKQLAWDLYTAWLVWHDPLAHVPHHWPPPGRSDLGCAGAETGTPFGGDYNSRVSPAWESYAAGGQGDYGGSGQNMVETSRGGMWVEHYESMGSSLSAWARGDVLGGCIARPMLALLGHIAARKSINVAPLRSGHAPNVANTDRESLHHRGRAADIQVVGGEGVEYNSAEGYWLWRFLAELKEQGRLTIAEIGSPWDLPNPVDGDGIFTDDDHRGHIHVGVCGVRYESMSGGETSDSC